MTLEALARSFTKHHITLVDAETLVCACDVCGTGFAPLVRPGGGLRRRFWECPNKCNAHPIQERA
jgi:hypothetical protein